MFGLGFWELFLILVVALLVFGPKELPEVARKLGRAAFELRRTLDEVRAEIDVDGCFLDLQDPPHVEKHDTARIQSTPNTSGNE